MMNHTEKIRESVLRLYKARNKRREVEKEVKVVEENECKEISNYMFCNNIKGFEVLIDGSSDSQYNELSMKPMLLRVGKSTSKKVTFLIDVIKNKLPKKLQKEVIRKEYRIINMDGLKDYLKDLGADPKVFKGFIQVIETVDKERMEQLYDFGEITLGQLKDCYEVKESKETITVRNIKI